MAIVQDARKLDWADILPADRSLKFLNGIEYPNGSDYPKDILETSLADLEEASIIAEDILPTVNEFFCDYTTFIVALHDVLSWPKHERYAHFQAMCDTEDTI